MAHEYVNVHVYHERNSQLSKQFSSPLLVFQIFFFSLSQYIRLLWQVRRYTRSAVLETTWSPKSWPKFIIVDRWRKGRLFQRASLQTILWRTTRPELRMLQLLQKETFSKCKSWCPVAVVLSSKHLFVITNNVSRLDAVQVQYVVWSCAV